MEIFLAPKVAPKRALTFLTNGAVTNFAPERMYRINADLLRTNVLVQNNEHRQSRQFPYRGRKTKPSNDKQIEKKINGMENAAAGMGGERSYCKRRNVAPVLGRLRIAVRTEHLEVCRYSQPVSCLVAQ